MLLLERHLTMLKLLCFTVVHASAFVPATIKSTRATLLFLSHSEDSSNVVERTMLDPAVAEKFKVVTCMSTSCSEKRKNLRLDDLATFGAFFSRAKQSNAPSVRVEEGPCLGACSKSPCVAIGHDDYIGSVSLEGMTEAEFSDRM